MVEPNLKPKVEYRKKCPVCGIMNQKEATTLYNQKYFCPDCVEIFRIETKDRFELIDYIIELYGEVPSAVIFKQIKEYKEEYSYTYKGMKATLNYFYTVLEGNDVIAGTGIGIVPYLYNETKRYYSDLKTIKDSVKNTDFDEIKKIKTVHIKKTDLKGKEKYKDMAMIDISQL